MKIVLASGVFDILHPGHLYFLRQARRLGDKLVVIVSSNETAKRQGKKSVFNEIERQSLIQSLAFVDEVVIGRQGESLKSIIDINPDIVALGYDQWDNTGELKMRLKKLGWKGEVVRIKKYGDYASSQVKNPKPK